MYKCGWNGCEKAYGTLNHLNAHVTMQSHGQKRTPEGKSLMRRSSIFLLTDMFFPQSLRRSARSGSSERRRRRPSARPRKSANARLLRRPLPRTAATLRPVRMELRPLAIPDRDQFSCLLSATNPHSTLRLLRREFPSSLCRTITTTCTPITNPTRLMLNPARESTANVS